MEEEGRIIPYLRTVEIKGCIVEHRCHVAGVRRKRYLGSPTIQSLTSSVGAIRRA